MKNTNKVIHTTSETPQILIFTGAGVSAESGIPTYREKDGLWENFKIDEICNELTWENHYTQVHEFYNDLRVKLEVYQPNTAHKVMADLKARYGNQAHLVTQNVDDLLEKAGASEVMHLHGDLQWMECRHCLEHWHIGYQPFDPEAPCPHCGQTDSVKPAVVFFNGMAPKYIDFQNLLDSMQHPDSVIVISGTLGNVVPIEFLVQDLPCRKVLNNLEAYEHIDDSVFDLVFYEPATTAWPKIEEYIDDVMKTNFSNDA